LHIAYISCYCTTDAEQLITLPHDQVLREKYIAIYVRMIIIITID
jgi:hypothetical protein